jgi:uncharacterized RDD family membrane protein YckC
MPTYYEILGVGPDASDEEIQAAYDAISKKCYAGLRDPKTHNECIERIKQIKQARDNLVNPEMRKRYDTASAEEETRKSAPPNPWRRFFARHFDQLVFFLIFYPVYRYFADYVFFEDWLFTLEAVGIGIALYVLLESAVLFLLGGTPGKWMLSIRLTDSDGQRPKRLQLVKRNLMLAVFGLALDVPPFSLIAMALQYRKVYKPGSDGLTAWDRACGTAVSYEPVKRLRLLLLLPAAALTVAVLVNAL